MLKKQLLNKIGQLSASSESSSQCLASLTKWAESLPDDTREPRGEAHYPGSYYQPLFNHMSQNHNMPLLQDQMDEIIRVVKEMTDDQPDLVPFKWPIPDGMEVVTRDGRKVEQLTRFEGINDNESIVGVVNGAIIFWKEDGKYPLCEKPYEIDLFLRRKEKKVWVVEWETGPGLKYTVLESEEIAKELPKSATNKHKIYEATLKPFV